jgi:hypothetical protein
MSDTSLRKRVTRSQTKDINNYQVTSELDAYTDTSAKTQEVTVTPTSSNKKQKTKETIDVSHISNDDYENTYTDQTTSQSHDMEVDQILEGTSAITQNNQATPHLESQINDVIVPFTLFNDTEIFP